MRVFGQAKDCVISGAENRVTVTVRSLHLRCTTTAKREILYKKQSMSENKRGVKAMFSTNGKLLSFHKALLGKEVR